MREESGAATSKRRQTLQLLYCDCRYYTLLLPNLLQPFKLVRVLYIYVQMLHAITEPIERQSSRTATARGCHRRSLLFNDPTLYKRSEYILVAFCCAIAGPSEHLSSNAYLQL